MATLKELQQETNKYKGTLVLDSLNVVLFLGVVDGGDDFYYKYVKFRETGYYKASCVGWIIPLKGKISEGEYESLKSMWNYNNPSRKAI